MEVNCPAPDFELCSFDGHIHRLRDYRGRIVIVNFWSAECPHAARADLSLRAALTRWGADVVLLAIASNANESVEALKNASSERGPFTVLLDADQRAADAFAAQVTPEAFVLDREGIVRYHGAVDNVTLRQRVPTRWFVEEAAEALLDGRLPAAAETPPFGCAIVRRA